MYKLLLVLLVLAQILPAFSQSYPGFEKKELINRGDTLRYRIQYPLNYDLKKPYPVILVLHGSGERGYDNEAQLKWGADLFADTATRKKFPAIVLFPQSQPTTSWVRLNYRQNDSLRFQFRTDTMTTPMALVIQLMETMAKSGNVDTQRIYVGGLSMGGMGTFEILWRKPGFFAAAFPICGGGDPDKVSTYAKGFPIWVFHGGADPVVPPANSRLMVNALKTAGAKVTYSEYPNVQHDSWKNAFAEPTLLTWMFTQAK